MSKDLSEIRTSELIDEIERRCSARRPGRSHPARARDIPEWALPVLTIVATRFEMPVPDLLGGICVNRQIMRVRFLAVAMFHHFVLDRSVDEVCEVFGFRASHYALAVIRTDENVEKISGFAAQVAATIQEIQADARRRTSPQVVTGDPGPSA